MYAGDIGTPFRVTLTKTSGGVVTNATGVTLTCIRPDATRLEKTLTPTTDGSDGVWQFTTVASDFPKGGTVRLQARVTTTGGSWPTNIATLEIGETL